MSKLEELIKEFCPNGVIRVTIGKICKISRGIVMSKDFIRDNHGDYPVYSSQTENNGCLGYINTYKYDGEYVTWTTDGANAGTVFYRSGKFSITNVCGLLEVKDLMVVNTKYLYYALSIEARRYVNQGMGNPKLMSNIMASVQIPLPALPVQREIVRILDSFTLYSAELTAELTARRKQYEFYRDKLLNFPQINKLSLAQCCLFQNGFAFKSDLFRQTGLPILRITNIVDGQLTKSGYVYFDLKDYKEDLSQYIVRKNDIVIAMSGATTGKIGWNYSDNNYYLNQRVGKFLPKENILNRRYLYFWLQSKQDEILQSALGSGAQPNLSSKTMMNFEIPVPPMDVQERIVKVLDNFDAICSDLGIGLPAEIEKRQKQYEYYRDKLLSF